MMLIFSKVNKFRVKKDEDGTTSCAKKTPLISKEFFSLKSDDNHISMTYNIKSHEDGLRFYRNITGAIADKFGLYASFNNGCGIYFELILVDRKLLKQVDSRLRNWFSKVSDSAFYLGNWKQITLPPYLPFCPSSVLLFRLHSLLCVLHNKTEDKQKIFAKWVGYIFPVTLRKKAYWKNLANINPQL